MHQYEALLNAMVEGNIELSNVIINPLTAYKSKRDIFTVLIYNGVVAEKTSGFANRRAILIKSNNS